MKKYNISGLLIIILILILLILLSKKRSQYREPFTQNKTKSNIYTCYSNVMSKKEEDILYQLIDIWTKVSNRLDIKWSVNAGTYIGLMRHGDRIPWDDDFDIIIMKEDLHKMKKIDKILSKYNISVSKFWGGYKIFFNDNRAITKFKNYGWNWPFIDIFTLDNDTESRYLEKNELPLKKIKFGKTYVYVYQNPNKNRTNIKNTRWKKEFLDTGYRHQIETYISKKCLPKKIK